MVRVALLALGLTAVAAPALLPSACGGKPEGSPGGAGATSASTGAGGHGAATTTTSTTTQSTSTSSTGTGGGASTSNTSTLGGDGWLPFPAEGCNAQYILNPPDWPKRTWTSCGPGCLVANANSIDSPWPPARYASGAKEIDGELYMLTSLGLDGEKIHELTRLSDGKVLTAVRHAFPDCLSGGGKRRTPFILDLFTDTKLGKETLAVYHPTTTSLSILGELVTNTIQDWFTWDAGWGLLDANQVRLGLTPGSAETTIVFKDGGTQTYARARKNMVIWVDESTFPPRIRRWTKELGVGVLYQSPDHDIRLALSDDAIAWIGGRPEPNQPYIYTDVAFYWASWSTTTLQDVTHGPTITGMLSGGNTIITGGDYVAVEGGGPGIGPDGLIVVQRSTQKKWYLYASGDHTLSPSALSKTELVVQELGPQPKLEFLNYRRYDLSRLDESSGPWPGPP